MLCFNKSKIPENTITYRTEGHWKLKYQRQNLLKKVCDKHEFLEGGNLKQNPDHGWGGEGMLWSSTLNHSGMSYFDHWQNYCKLKES